MNVANMPADYARECEELLTSLTTGATDTSSGPMNPNNLRDAKGKQGLDGAPMGGAPIAGATDLPEVALVLRR